MGILFIFETGTRKTDRFKFEVLELLLRTSKYIREFELFKSMKVLVPPCTASEIGWVRKREKYTFSSHAFRSLSKVFSLFVL